MPASTQRVSKIFEGILKKFNGLENLLQQFRSPEKSPPPPLPRTLHWNQTERDNRIQYLANQGARFEYVTQEKIFTDYQSLRGNIENFIGFSQIPIGVAGPLRINGLNAHGDFFVPLATSEGALVASMARGAQVITESGGARTIVMVESVSRAPVFIFDSVVDACLFCQWVTSQFEKFEEVVGTKSRHGKLLDINSAVIGSQAHLIFSYSTGDASGQNMVTICTEAICEKILETSPFKPNTWFIEGNLSGDKKPTAISFLSARGKKVVAEVEIPRDIVRRLLHTEPEKIFEYWKTSFVGGVQSGSIGVNGHYANPLAALFLACGQDVACVSESCVGLTICDVRANGNLYMSVTLPNLIVGTVGGGCNLPTTRECLELLGCYGAEKARTFAEICAATVLAGEISISGALAAGDFTRAHRVYGRKPVKIVKSGETNAHQTS